MLEVEVEPSTPETAPEPTTVTEELIEEEPLSLEPETDIIFDPTSPMLLVIPESASDTTVTLGIYGYNQVNLGGYEYEIHVDALDMTLTGGGQGTALASTGRTVGPLGPEIHPGSAQLDIGAYSTGAQSGFSGDGSLSSVTMNVTGNGIMPVWFEKPLFVSPDAESQVVAAPDAEINKTTIQPGWNLSTACVDASYQTVPQAFAALDGSYDLVLGTDGQHTVGGTGNDLQAIDPDQGYWVRMTAADEQPLIYAGLPYTYTPGLSLEAGWHWLGYCGEGDLFIEDALASLSGKYDVVADETGAYAVDVFPIYRTFTRLTPGDAYLIHLTAPGVLSYPDTRENVTDLEPAPRVDLCSGVQQTPYATLVFGAVRIDGTSAPAGTKVEFITPRGDVAGCMETQTGGLYGLMQIYGEDSSGGIPGFRDGESISIRVNGCTADSTLDWQDDHMPNEVLMKVDGSTCTTTDTTFIYLPIMIR